MAKELKPFGIRVDYNLDSDDAKEDHVVVELFKRNADADNETVGTRTYKPSSLPDAINRQATLYGISKLVQDRTSDESGTESRLPSMDEVWARFVSGQWEKERESGGPTVRIEVEALAAIKGVAVADIQRSLRDYDAEAREKILNSAVVQAKVEELKAKASDVEVDLSDLT